MKQIKIKSYKSSYTVENCNFDQLNKIFDSSYKSVMIIDKLVLDIYKKKLNFFSFNFLIVVDAIEDNKDLNFIIQKILKIFIKNNINKGSDIFVIGGGIIQDISSFACSIYHRGIPWTFVPTTLLSQADSCIGSKTSINFNKTKNILGTFFPPKKVYLCDEFINSLKKEDFFSGIGEIIKFHLLSNKQNVNFLDKNIDKLYLKQKNYISQFILKTLKIKKIVIEKDEFDISIRRLFNYGHCIGHSIEAASNYKIPHGIAICFGMKFANLLSYKKKYLNKIDLIKFNNIINKNLLKSNSIKKISFKKILIHLHRDKKNSNQKINIILTKGIGKMFVEEILDINILNNTWLQLVAKHK